MPVVLKCPFCNLFGWHIYQTEPGEVEWTYCRNCHYHGDMIELAADLWKLDLTSAVTKLSLDNALPPEARSQEVLEAYLAKVAVRRRAEVFWQEANRCQSLSDKSDISLIQHNSGILYHMNSHAWTARGGRLVGITTRNRVAELRSHGRKKTAPSIFHGKNWGDLVVLPFHDLPGRLCGFGFLGRKADLAAGDFVYWPIHANAADAGVMMIDSMMTGKNQYLGHTLFAITDPLAALQLQLRWLASNPGLLPIVYAHQDESINTGRLWKRFPARKRVFWGGPGNSIKTIALARLAGGFVTTIYCSPSMSLNYAPPLDWLRTFAKNPLHWSNALHRRLQQASDEAAMQLLNSIGMTGTEKLDYLNCSPPETRDRMLHIFTANNGSLQTTVNKQVIVEDAGGWYVDGQNPERICNALIRLEQVVRMPGGKNYYRGWASMTGNRVPFVLQLDKVQKEGLFNCLSSLMLERHMQLVFSAQWNKHAETIAQRLHPPSVVTGVDYVGWDREEGCFRFPHFTLHANGNAVPADTNLFTEVGVPCENLRSPAVFGSTDVEGLLDGGGVQGGLQWATAAAVITNLLAMPLGHPTAAIGVNGSHISIELTMQIAKALGCHERPFPIQAETAFVQMSKHHWPVRFTRTPTSAESVDSIARSPYVKNCLIQLDWLSSRAVLTRKDWLLIGDEGLNWRNSLNTDAIEKIVPHYLKSLCERHFRLPRSYVSPVENVLADLHIWMRQYRAAPFDLNMAMELVTPPDRLSAWEPFLDIVLYGLRTRSLSLLDAQDSKSKLSARLGAAVVRTPTSIAVDILSLQALLSNNKSPQLAISNILASLGETGALQPDRTSQTIRLERSWWERERRVREMPESGQLRLIK